MQTVKYMTTGAALGRINHTPHFCFLLLVSSFSNRDHYRCRTLAGEINVLANLECSEPGDADQSGHHT
jgi:hypothetical protein